MIDTARLTALFAAHAGPLTLYARQFDAGEAEELVQEAFVRLLTESAEPPNVRAWLVVTLRRLAIDRQRSWLRRLRRERSKGRSEWFVPAADDSIDARHAVELLRHLPARQREVIVLRVWNDLTLEQIAGVLKIATSTAHADLHAGLSRLKHELEPTRAR